MSSCEDITEIVQDKEDVSETIEDEEDVTEIIEDNDITEIIENGTTTSNKKKKRKRKKKKTVDDDSVQMIGEMSNLNKTVDTSIEILDEHRLKIPTSNNLVDSSKSMPTTHNIEKAADFISFSDVSSTSTSQTTQSSSSTNLKSCAQETFGDLFQIDTAPCESRGKREHVPKYVSKFSESALSEEKSPAKKSWRPPALCFNCNGDHAIRDCKKPRNQMNIMKNRNIFMANKAKQMGNVTASRYHLDHHQRFAHLKAGSISKRLQRALNLAGDQLPLHVYKMRMVGYPPAWLEEAKVKHSGIAVFDSSGLALADPEDEDGEVEVDRCKYDMKKIIEYPGFNVRPPKNTLNESDYLGFPDMLPEQHRERMISFLAPRAAQPYKKRKIESKDLNQSGESKRNSTDMEVDEVPETMFEDPGNCAFIPSLPDEPVPPPPPEPPSNPPPPGTEEEEEGEIKEDDEEGKGVKRKATEEENGGSSKRRKSDEFAHPSTSSQSTASSQPSTSSQNTTSSQPSTSSQTTTSSQSSTRASSPSTLSKSSSSLSLGSIKVLDMGTPIIQHAESAEKLPSHEAFSKNICDVINFDNLPDSTGKYKVLSKVVKRVRTFMSKITGKNS